MKNSFAIDMKIATPALAWEIDLAANLSASGLSARLVPGQTEAGIPGLSMIRSIERLVIRGRYASAGAGAPRPIPPAPAEAATPADLVVDLACEALGAPSAPTLVPLYDGLPGRRHAVDAVLSRRKPAVSLAYASPSAPDWRIVATVRPAFERHGYYSPTIDTLFTAARGVLERTIARLAHRGGPADAVGDAALSPTTVSRAATSTPAFLSSLLARKVAERLTGAGRGPERWSIGIRRLGTSVRDTHAWSSESYLRVPDEPGRCFADPFLFEHEGRTWLFCEEIAMATGKGSLAVAELRPDGGCDVPRPIEGSDGHLSYPHVFHHDGRVWMIPETGSAGRIELWRCERFPDRFVPHAVLVDKVVAGDATFFEHAGRFWLSATVEGPGSTWDSLCLWSADRLAGPWRPHPANPVLVDAGCARPAGAFWRDRDGMLWRPAQDCSTGYGAAIVLCRVDRCDEEAFAQTPVTRLAPRPEWRGAVGTHTLNVGGGFEAVDWHGPA